MNQYKSIYRLFTQNSFLKSSTVLFIGSLFVNILSYLFNLSTGRLLTEVEFGEFQSIASILYLSSIPATVLGTVTVNFIAQYLSKNEISKIKYLLVIMTKYTISIGIIACLISLLFSYHLQSVLNLNSIYPIFALALLLFLTFPQIITNATLQGFELFSQFSLLSIFLMIFRIILVFIFYFFNILNVTTVLLSIVISTIIPYLISWLVIEKSISKLQINTLTFSSKLKSFFYHLTHSIPSSASEIKKEISLSTGTTLIAVIGLAGLVQMDIILAKAFLTPQQAGLYASLAISGKVIPFFTQPLVQVMFPQLVRQYTQKQPFFKLFALVFSIVLLSSLSISAFYFLFPDFVRLVFYGNKFLQISSYLGLFSVFQLLYALTNTFTLFFLAIGKSNYASLTFLSALFQSILIFFFHANLTQIISSSIVVLFITVIGYSALSITLFKQTR
ncbi:MAG: oligosaccharide flippase family protein [bacterium]|nr:oligosaccharide flippase family protein [bacterium]